MQSASIIKKSPTTRPCATTPELVTGRTVPRNLSGVASDSGSDPNSGSLGTDASPVVDSGLWALAAIASHYRIAAHPAQVAHDLGLHGRPSTSQDIVRAARRLGLKAKLLQGQDLAR